MVSVPDTWSEVAKVAIAAQAGSDIHFDSLTETVDIDMGDKDFDVISTLSGGRMVKFTPQEPTTITLEAYPVQAGTSGTTGTGTGFYDLMNTQDTSQPVVVSADRVRNKYRIAVMWTNDVTSTTYAESQVVSPTYAMLRVVAADGYFTSVKPSFTDGVLKFTIVYKVPPFDKSGVANIKIESLDGSATATLTALASYTLTTKW
jgi:hypothetical protein